MKNLISFIFILFFSSNLFSQNQGPDVAWKRHDTPFHVIDGPIVNGVSPSNPAPGDPVTIDNSGEDWWYDIENIYESGIHVGYMVCGFTSFIDIEIHEDVTGGCEEKLGTGSNCERPIIAGEKLSSKVNSISRYDLNGNMLWCESFSLAEEGFYALIRTNDDNFVAIGWGKATRRLDGAPIMYNPGQSNYNLSDDCAITRGSKMLVTKFTPDGNIIWMNAYGHFDTNLGLAFAMEMGIFGLDLVEKLNGDIRLIGETTTNTIGDKKVAVIDITPGGNYINSEIFGDNGKDNRCRAIIRRDGTDDYYVTATELNGTDGDAVLFKLGNDLTIPVPFGTGDSYGTINAVRINDNNIGDNKKHAPRDVIVQADGTVVWSVIENCQGCVQSDLNFGELFLYRHDPNGILVDVIEVATVNTLSFNKVLAFDLKVGLVSTSDGGFACVSSYQVAPLIPQTLLLAIF